MGRVIIGVDPHKLSATIEVLDDRENVSGLAERYPTSPSDHDRVVMSVRLEIRWSGERNWTGEYVVDVQGTDIEDATPRLVSVPLACGILELLTGRVPPDLHRAAEDPEAAERWLARPAEQDIVAQYYGDPIPQRSQTTAAQSREKVQGLADPPICPTSRMVARPAHCGGGDRCARGTRTLVGAAGRHGCAVSATLDRWMNPGSAS